MKAYKYILLAATLAVTASCADDRNALSGEGALQIQASVNSDVKVVPASRGALEDQYGESLLLWISNSKGQVVREYKGISNVPSSAIALMSGKYLVEGWAGDSVSASFTDRWFKGSAEVDIVSGQTASVDLVCKIANVVVSVEYTPEVDELLTDYSLTVGHARGQLTMEGENLRGYFMMPSTDKNLEWTLSGTKKSDGAVYTRSGIIENARSGYEYAFNIGASTDDSELGGGILDIVIDETEVEVEDTITISIAPVISGIGFDVDETLFADPGDVGRVSLFIAATDALKNVLLESDDLDALTGIGGNDVDLLLMSAGIRQNLENIGIKYVYDYDATEGSSTMKIVFDDTFTDALPLGQYEFTVTATDASDKVSTKTLKLNLSGNPLVAAPIAVTDAWATHISLKCSVLQPDITDVTLRYRPIGDEWTEQNVAVTSGVASIELTGLAPVTTYEFQFVSGEYRTEIDKFTTEAIAQIPNSGFESWNTSSTPYLLYAPGEDMFWDSGNHGSATLSTNITVPDATTKHSGQYSACLQSQFVALMGFGKFAAGNCFTGQYLGTEGTDGVLGFGRPFASRPAGLKGYVKYRPGDVKSNGSKNNVNGPEDKGIIYMALLDNTTESVTMEGKTYEFPVIIKTKQSKFFDKNAANVIAYGEILFPEATEGEDLVEFYLPFDYKSLDRKVYNVLIVCAASHQGDYFIGANSTMWVDDLEFVYE